jgi:hypothetical protein
MSTADLLGIARICQRDYGLRVEFAAGWSTRGRTSFSPTHVAVHHTAGISNVDKLLIEGRPGIPGPLCQIALHKDALVKVIGAFRANHAGVATVTNTHAYGIEATGPIPLTGFGPTAFPQYDAYVRLVAAICRHHGWGIERVVAHKEIAIPRGRKVDPYFDMAAFRDRVAVAMRRPGPVTPAPQEDDLPYTRDQLKAIFREVLNEGTGTGQKDWAGTEKATLHTMQTVVNLINGRTGALANGITDARSAILAALAATQFDLLPAEQVDELADEIAAKLRAAKVPAPDRTQLVEAIQTRVAP